MYTHTHTHTHTHIHTHTHTHTHTTTHTHTHTHSHTHSLTHSLTQHTHTHTHLGGMMMTRGVRGGNGRHNKKIKINKITTGRSWWNDDDAGRAGRELEAHQHPVSCDATNLDYFRCWQHSCPLI